MPEATEGDAARLDLYDVMGRRVRSMEVPAETGRHERLLDVGGLTSGIYVLFLRVGGDATTRKLTVVR